MVDKNSQAEVKKVKNWGTGGGMYCGAKVSVKTLNKIIFVLMVALVGVVIYLATTSHYAVTFETNGGEDIPVYQCKHGEYIDSMTPSKTGYEFTGWYQDKDLTKDWDLKKDTVQQSITLYASWKPLMIIVNYDLNGGNIEQKTMLPSKEIAFHEKYGELPIPSKKGYTFSGWQYNQAIIDSATIVSMNGEHTLKALWQ